MEQLDSASARRLPTTIEWPTVGVLVAFWGAVAAIIGWHERLPTMAVIAVLALLGGWFMSMQHEVLHGHPTPWSRLNVAFVATPLSLWLPYPLYRESHLAHHDSDLTVPGLDPESFYLDQATWDGAPGWRRRVYRLHHTLVGRMLLGPAFGPTALLRDEVAAVWGNRSRRRIWLVHLAGSAVVCWVVFGVAAVPVWQYIIGFCYLGMSLTYLRSYAEHLARAELTRRTAIPGESGWSRGASREPLGGPTACSPLPLPGDRSGGAPDRRRPWNPSAGRSRRSRSACASGG